MTAPKCCGYPMIPNGITAISGNGTATTQQHWKCSICNHTTTTTRTV